MLERRKLSIREKLLLGFGGIATAIFITVIYVFQALNTLKTVTEVDGEILAIQRQIIFIAALAVAAAAAIAIAVIRFVTTEMQVMDDQKIEFSALTSHQLRTPPTIIKYDTEILLSGDAGQLTRKQQQYMREIEHANQRMIDIIHALLNVSRMEMGTFSIQPQEVDICALVRSVSNEVRPVVREKHIIYTVSCTRIPKIYADPRLARIVLQNVIGNAVKYTENGGKITVSAYASERDLFIEVTDTGCGIPKEVQAHVFTKLFRADNARLLDPEGTGLGLYIARAIARNVGGKMWFESVEGKGSSFFFTLPRKGLRNKAGRSQLAIDSTMV